MSVKNPNVLLQYSGSFSRALLALHRMERQSLIMTQYWGKREIQDLQEEKNQIIRPMISREIGLGFIGKDISNNFFELDEFSRFTQPESQKALYILKVLTVLDWYHELNTSAIIKKTGLSPKSVVGTLKILRGRGLVDYKVKKKWNNEKIYSIRRLRALFYILKLIQWKFNKGFQDMLNKIWEKESIINDKFPKELENIPISLSEKWKKRIPKNILPKDNSPIKEWNTTVSNTIKMMYNSGLYCDECFKKGMLSEPILDNEELICPKCGIASKFNEEVYFMADPYLKSKRESYRDDENIKNKIKKH